MAKTKKNIMREFKINEISGVDVPAQPDATVSIMKRAPKDGKKKDPLDEKPEEDNEDSTLEGSEDDSEAAKGGKQQSDKENKMADDKKAAEMEKAAKDLQKKLDDTAAENAVLKALSEMNDAEKTHFKGLDKAAQEAWLKKSADERKGDLAKAAEGNPVVYKALDGTEFRKSDDSRLVAMAKSADESAKALSVEKALRIDGEFAKRANDELNFIKGDAVEKIALLKAVAGIADEAVRGKVAEILKAANTAFSPAFQTLGVTKGKEVSAPEAELESLAKAHQAKNSGVSYAKAYDAVLQTAEGQSLYNKTQNK